MPHDDQAVQPELVDELAHDARVLGGGVPVARRAVGEAEAGVVDGQAAEPVPQGGDQVAVEEAPRRVPVEHEDRLAFALVHVVDPADGAPEPPRLEGVEVGGGPEAGRSLSDRISVGGLGHASILSQSASVVSASAGVAISRGPRPAVSTAARIPTAESAAAIQMAGVNPATNAAGVP